MPSLTKLMNLGFINKYTSMQYCVGLDNIGMGDLAVYAVTPTLQGVILGDYTKWCSHLIYIPIDITRFGSKGKLTVGGETTDVDAYDLNVNTTFGFTLGQYHYEGKYKDFRDYEPYTTLQIYLPFYGYVDVPIAEVIDKYIQFRLKVDFATGNAIYIIGVNHNSVYSPNKPYYLGTDDTFTRILSTISFNIGADIPLGSVGMNDAVRNMAMSVVKGAAMVAGSYAALAVGAGKSETTQRDVTTVRTKSTARNPATGRQVTMGTNEGVRMRESEREYDNTSFYRGKAASSVIETAGNALSSMGFNPHSDICNNPSINDQGPLSIIIVRKYAKVVEATSSYNHLYGKPLGDTLELNSVHGYTEISSIHLEGVGFATATNKEMAMIENEILSGIILP